MWNEWLLTDKMPPLEADMLQVWRLTLSSDRELFQTRRAVLSNEEMRRSDRLRKGRVQNQFVMGRWFLRTLLGKTLGLIPREVTIEMGAQGKLFTQAVGERSVSFNVAHSKDTILVALCQQGAIGVDLEDHDATVEAMGVAEAVFHPKEVARLAAYGNDRERLRAFYRCWTQKEAVAKADGRGMSLPFTCFEVPVELAGGAEVVVEGPDFPGKKVFFLHDLSMENGMSATVAVDIPNCRISTLTIQTI